MYSSIIDSHIHFDLYEKQGQDILLRELRTYGIKALISVSENLQSAQKNLSLSQMNHMIKPAFGFHPEQPIPETNEINELHQFINKHHQQMVAIGEVGLPYYLRKEQPKIPLEPYIDILEGFVKLAAVYNKPIILHAIYEDASIVCDLLEKSAIKKAHFHWFKGDKKTIDRLIAHGYYISITPDVLYEQEIQQLTEVFPLSLMMVETDGPWPFDGPFNGQLTHPKMIHKSVQKIAQIKGMNVKKVYETLYQNTKKFYQC